MNISRIRYLPPLAFLAVLAGVWQVWTTVGHVPEYLVPSPSQIWAATTGQWDLLSSSAVPTVEIAVLGYLLALAVGVLLAIAMHFSRMVEMVMYPIVVASQTVPVVALAPVLVITLGFDIWPKLVIVALVCVLPIVVNTVDGLKSVDPDLVNLMRSLGASRVRRFREVDWPTALPYVISGAKVAVTYSLIGELYGEWAGASQGLGYLMTQKEAEFDTQVIFAAVLVLSVLGIGMFLAVAGVGRLLVPWQYDAKRSSLWTWRNPWRGRN
jgi:ABC-type nitrate/sulfonate/bicarbonate transport system permease component